MTGSKIIRWGGALALCLLTWGWASTAWANGLGGPVGPPVRLDQLLGPNGGSIQVDDKLFDDFTYSWTGDMPASDLVNVAPYIDSDGNPGLQITGGFQDLPGNNASDAVFGYSVWVTHPDIHVLINDIHLLAQMAVAGGPGNVLITEGFGDTDPASLTVFYEDPPGMNISSDWTDLSQPRRHFRVEKNILANATGQSGIAAVTIINQSFSQITVPEPNGSVLSLMFAALICGLRRRRRACC